MRRIFIPFLIGLIVWLSACNKVDAGRILEGYFKFSNLTSYTLYNYKIVADTYQLTTVFQNYYFDEPLPAVQFDRLAKDKVNFKQFVPGDTVAFNNVTLTLDRGGTIFKSEFSNNRKLEGLSSGYFTNYDIVDTATKQLVRVQNLPYSK